MFETEDLPSYIPGYDEWCEERQQEDYDNGYIDEMIEEMLMEERERECANATWVLLYNTKNIKTYIALGTNLYKDEFYNDDGTLRGTSTYKKGR